MREHLLYIGGSWRRGGAGTAQPAWASLSAFERAAWCARVAGAIAGHGEELARALTQDQGKPLVAEAYDEVSELAGYFRMAGEDAKRLAGELPPSVSAGRRVLSTRVPLGVIGIVSPWNWPYTMGAELFAPALAAGKTQLLDLAQADAAGWAGASPWRPSPNPRPSCTPHRGWAADPARPHLKIPSDPEGGENAVTMPSALEISRQATPKPVAEIAAEIGLPPWLIEPYGEHVAKIDLGAVGALAGRPRARYVVVTAVTPTPLGEGEGKTTTTIGLGQAMAVIGKRATIAIRQASMGPTFGIKGGAAGGGYSQAVPFERLNLHLTGDMHAVTAAHNTLAAMVDNHLYHGNAFGLDLHDITWRRVLDVNDRALRNIVLGLGTGQDGQPRQSGFDITAASEVMAVLALSSSLRDMRERLGRIVVGYTAAGEPVTAEQLKAAGAMTVIMRDAIKPNLLQTLENTPVLVHAGPFGNIAHGNSSVVADLIGIHTGDFLITEAGFGADMGAERFFNIKCRVSGLVPDAAVVVTTVRALKVHSGRHRVVAGEPLPPALLAENPEDVLAGAVNLRKQIENVRLHGVTPVVAINAMPGDFASEHAAIAEVAASMGVRCAVCTHFTDGGRGAAALAEAVAEAAAEPGSFQFLYPAQAPIREKIETIATRVYGADGVDYTPVAARQLDSFEKVGFGSFPVCIAKTHLSLSADPVLKGAPAGWRLPVREVRASAGAGFIYPICGDMRTMPGLGSHPAAERIDIDAGGQVVGLT